MSHSASDKLIALALKKLLQCGQTIWQYLEDGTLDFSVKKGRVILKGCVKNKPLHLEIGMPTFIKTLLDTVEHNVIV